MPNIQLTDRLSIYYEDHRPSGSPSVLLLHGLGVNCESWVKQVPAFQEAGFRVITPDIRCFGKSTYPGGSVSIRQLAGDMISLLHHLMVNSVVVVGISLGGVVALQLALDDPKLVSRLVLINTFSHLRPRSLRIWLYFASRFILAHVVGVQTQAVAVANHLFPDPEDAEIRAVFITQISKANPSGYRAVMRALAHFNVSERLQDITIPTLVITGAEDTTVPFNVQKELAKSIPNARHEVIPGAGHAVTIERAEMVNHLIISFST